MPHIISKARAKTAGLLSLRLLGTPQQPYEALQMSGVLPKPRNMQQILSLTICSLFSPEEKLSDCLTWLSSLEVTYHN